MTWVNPLWEKIRSYYNEHENEHVHLSQFDPEHPDSEDEDLKIEVDREGRLELSNYSFHFVARPWGWTIYEKTEDYDDAKDDWIEVVSDETFAKGEW